MAIDIYRIGPVHCSVCAPRDLSEEQLEAEVNQELPTGIVSNWKVSTAETFCTGESNPCVCNNDPNKLHYLMVC